MFVDPETGDFLFRGKTVTDPDVIRELNGHIGKADDESDIWLPARMATLIREALDGYQQGRQGPGPHTFAELLASATASVIRFEMRDSYDHTEKGLAEWQATGSAGRQATAAMPRRPPCGHPALGADCPGLAGFPRDRH